MFFKNNKFNFIICGIIITAIILVTVVTVFFINSYSYIEVWERSDDNYLNETMMLEEENNIDHTKVDEAKERETESDYEKANEQTNEEIITSHIIEVTDKTDWHEEKAEIEIKKEETDKTAEKEELYCTIEVSCDTILDNIDKLDKEKKELIPADGVIFNKKEVDFKKGESAFDVLLRVMKESGIHMEFVKVPVKDNVYIEGINNIYEFDCGELSGWMYKVNGEFPNYGCGKYYLEKGDSVEFIYTCDLGRDIGGAYINQK